MKNHISDSKFKSWQCLVALMHIEGSVRPKEREWIKHCLSKLEMTEGQVKAINNSLERPEDYKSFLPDITDVKDFSNLLHLSNILFNLDGHLSTLEKQAIENLNDHFRKFYSPTSRLQLTKAMLLTESGPWSKAKSSVDMLGWGTPPETNHWLANSASHRLYGFYWILVFLFRYPWIVFTTFALCLYFLFK